MTDELELSGNPSSERPSQVIKQLKALALRFESEDFKTAWVQLIPEDCPCCVQSLFDDAATMLTAFAETPEGAELEQLWMPHYPKAKS